VGSIPRRRNGRHAWLPVAQAKQPGARYGLAHCQWWAHQTRTPMGPCNNPRRPGRKIGVASTKALRSPVAACAFGQVLHWAAARKKLEPGRAGQGLCAEPGCGIPRLWNRAEDRRGSPRRCPWLFQVADSSLGRGLNTPLPMEGALKLRTSDFQRERRILPAK